ncbi:MAG: DUF72 domain-containing protein [Chitinophagaceae bacterium]
MNADLNFQKGYYSGISGLQLHIPKYLFPPPYENVSRLTYYSTFFNSIEINSSFYKIPKPATIAKWSASVNDHFKFTFKLWKEITHCKGFDFKKEDVAIFINSINHVQNKKGCLLIQFPPGLGKEYKGQINKLLGYIRELEPVKWNIAIEFRNKSWYNASTYALLKKFKATLVIHDIPKSATPSLNQETDFLYFRFHGPTGNYRDSYAEDFLKEYASYVNELLTNGKRVFVYFNNTMGDALNNLKTLNGFLNNKI